MPRKASFVVGSRIQHKIDTNLSEGVIVFVNTGKEKPYSVHWNNNKTPRGHYSESELLKVNSTSTLLTLRKQIEEEQ